MPRARICPCAHLDVGQRFDGIDRRFMYELEVVMHRACVVDAFGI